MYRAKWKRNTDVAIKMMKGTGMEHALHKTTTATTPSGRMLLSLEMKLFRDLHHPHVVACYGILEDRGENHIVTELCKVPLDTFCKMDRYWQFTDDDERIGMTQVGPSFFPRFFPIFSRFPRDFWPCSLDSWRPDAENGRKMGKDG